MNLIEKVFELLKPVSGKFSTKFLLAVGAVFALWDLAKAGGLEPMYAAVGIVIVTVTYYFARHRQETNTKKP